jgi:hypothetical protein
LDAALKAVAIIGHDPGWTMSISKKAFNCRSVVATIESKFGPHWALLGIGKNLLGGTAAAANSLQFQRKRDDDSQTRLHPDNARSGGGR